MFGQDPLEMATGGHQQVPQDWMPATRVRPFIFEDPVLVWLEYHGKQHGFQPDTSPYQFLDFIGEKGRQFEEKWTKELAPGAVRVCGQPYDVRSADKVRETFDLMRRGTPVIAQPALWWAPERIYGVPDLLVHTSWLEDRLPRLLREVEKQAVAENLASTIKPGHYVILDIKFTTKLDEPQKAEDLQSYAAQVRIYSYILGHLQGLMPQRGYIVTRDRILDPLRLPITSGLEQPLDGDLRAIRDQFVDIKLNGSKYVPWRDDIVVSNIKKNRDEGWATAKGIIARDKVPGGDPGLLYQIGLERKRTLAAMGFPTLDSMLRPEPNAIPFEKCKGLGPAYSKRIRAILEANRSGFPVRPPSQAIPPRKRLEFYIDFEFFNNLNVEFDRQWPTLNGCEMIFMIGVGWEDEDRWLFVRFVATAEDQREEYKMLEEFLRFLRDRAGDALTDGSNTAIYHWSHAEKTQARQAADRHQLPDSHPLCNLPWCDLEKVFLDGPSSVPGAWGYGLKEVAKSLGRVNPAVDPEWPGDLDEGLQAMVMGWNAYRIANPLESQEMKILSQYLEADCRALYRILKWMRS